MSNILSFSCGSLLIENPEECVLQMGFWIWDDRVQLWRTWAYRYREVVEFLCEKQRPYEDRARGFRVLDLHPLGSFSPRPVQREALKAWQSSSWKGTICLPTGGGKTLLAIMGIVHLKRSTCVVVPTIDLLHQWAEILKEHVGVEVSLYGGGFHEVGDITIITYDSALMHMSHLGSRFALMVFDECHHLPGPQNQNIARESLAPFRLGLSATVLRQDGGEDILFQLVGPLVYEGKMEDLIGHGLSPYEVITKQIPLTEEEEKDYTESRLEYISFLKKHGVEMSRSGGWQDFLRLVATRGSEGRAAMAAYLKQRRVVYGARGKLNFLWDLLQVHMGDRMIVFTSDNATAYAIGRMFFLAVLTHKTSLSDRKRMLEGFRSGEMKVLVTSRVLNEGVDVPEARVGVVFSGTATVREHVQRLGRILRACEGKKAIMYELISENTYEFRVSQKRREHDAYQRSFKI